MEVPGEPPGQSGAFATGPWLVADRRGGEPKFDPDHLCHASPTLHPLVKKAINFFTMPLSKNGDRNIGYQRFRTLMDGRRLRWSSVKTMLVFPAKRKTLQEVADYFLEDPDMITVTPPPEVESTTTLMPAVRPSVWQRDCQTNYLFWFDEADTDTTVEARLRQCNESWCARKNKGGKNVNGKLRGRTSADHRNSWAIICIGTAIFCPAPPIICTGAGHRITAMLKSEEVEEVSGLKHKLRVMTSRLEDLRIRQQPGNCCTEMTAMRLGIGRAECGTGNMTCGTGTGNMNRERTGPISRMPI
eukprot:g18622.t1